MSCLLTAAAKLPLGMDESIRQQIYDGAKIIRGNKGRSKDAPLPCVRFETQADADDFEPYEHCEVRPSPPDVGTPGAPGFPLPAPQTRRGFLKALALTTTYGAGHRLTSRPTSRRAQGARAAQARRRRPRPPVAAARRRVPPRGAAPRCRPSAPQARSALMRTASEYKAI